MKSAAAPGPNLASQDFTPDRTRLDRWYQRDLFPPRAVDLYRIVDEYAAECCRQIAGDLGLFARFSEAQAVEPVLDQLQVAPSARPLMRRVVQVLCQYGAGEAQGGRVRLWSRRSTSERAALRAEGLAADPALEPAFLMADKVVDSAASFCRGVIEDDEVRAKVHVDFFVSCPVGRQSSELGGGVIRQLVEDREGPVDILELGGGTMSAAVGVLDALAAARLDARVRRYHFSELNPFFVMEARRRLPERYPAVGSFAFHLLNFDEPFEGRGLGPASVDIVHGVNCLHCAKDLPATLVQIAQVLRPGGLLVVPQFTRMSPHHALPLVNLVCDPLASYWDVRLDPEQRPIHGLLDAASWSRSLRASGFRQVEVFPDQTLARRCFGDRYFIGAVVARKASA